MKKISLYSSHNSFNVFDVTNHRGLSRLIFLGVSTTVGEDTCVETYLEQGNILLSLSLNDLVYFHVNNIWKIIIICIQLEESNWGMLCQLC